jgi:hypothetical protein
MNTLNASKRYNTQQHRQLPLSRAAGKQLTASSGKRALVYTAELGHYATYTGRRLSVCVHQSMSPYHHDRVNAGFKIRFTPYRNYFEKHFKGKMFNFALFNYLTGKHMYH